MRFQAVEWRDSVPSTNRSLAERFAADPGLRSGVVLATTRQTAGRGRHQRTWLTTPGQDLAFSFLVREQVEPAWIPSLSMVAALGVARALGPFGVAPRLKWPNDVLAGDRKISGILSECIAGPVSPCPAAVVGVGLNVNMPPEQAAAIDRPATSIRIETGREQDVRHLLGAVLRSLEDALNRWQTGGFPAIREEWLAGAWGIGLRMTIGDGDKAVRGVLTGFGEHGEAFIEDKEGAQHTLLLGEVLEDG